jgi:hypothetical protein
MRRVCFYHAGCPDGFGAAWAVQRAWDGTGSYVARGHDDRLRASNYVGNLVVFVDIAPPNRIARELGEAAAQLVILDHHVSSRDRLAGDPGLENELAAAGHMVVFDLSRSGAVLAWQHFHPGEPVPDLLRYVEDQDLWHWKLPHSDEVNAALGSYPRRFEVWDELAQQPVEVLAREGEPIVRANRIDVERALQGVHPARLGGLRVEAVNARHLRSAIGHELAKRAAYGSACGLVYRLVGERVDASIYSIGEFDVARIAAGYGGGGHRNAAGFSVRLRGWLDDFI